MASVAYPIEASLADLFDSVFDAIVVVGGDGAPEHLWDNSSVLGTLRRHLAGGSLICAICFGVVALARAGVLAGRRATVYPDRRAELEIARGGAILAADPLVADGNVLTARGPSDAGLLAQTILARLGA